MGMEEKGFSILTGPVRNFAYCRPANPPILRPRNSPAVEPLPLLVRRELAVKDCRDA